MATVGQRVGRFEVVEEIGRGGMAVVYRARQLDLDRAVALKELPAFHAADAAFAERFLREARIAGSLSHPNVVVVFDYLESEGTPFIAMELVERGSLRPLVGRLSLAQVGGVLEGVLSALSHAESRQVVHRDLKPENLMVTGDGAVKIADFGIAKAIGAVASGRFLTATGTTVGTPTYMAPEQALGQEVTPATDLYAVGVIAYELLVGRAPFTAQDTPMAVLFSHVNDPPPPARSLRPDIDEGLETWLARMLAKAPAERPRSAHVAWEELEEILIGVLGPRWRREARLVGVQADAAAAKPLTPAPFHDTSDEPAEDGGFVTVVRSGGAPPAAADPPAAAPVPASAPPVEAAPSTPPASTPGFETFRPAAAAAPPLAEPSPAAPAPEAPVPEAPVPEAPAPAPMPTPAFETFRPAAAVPPPPAPPPPPPAVEEAPEPPPPLEPAAPAAVEAEPAPALAHDGTPAGELTVPPAARAALEEPEAPVEAAPPPDDVAEEPPALPAERRGGTRVPTRLVAGVLGAVVVVAGIGYAVLGRGGSHAKRAVTAAVGSTAAARTSTAGTTAAPAPTAAPVSAADRMGLDDRGGSLYVTDPARGVLVAYATAPAGGVARLRLPVAPTAVGESGTNRAAGFLWVAYPHGLLRVGAGPGGLVLTGQGSQPSGATAVAADTNDPVAAISRVAVCVGSAAGRAPDACADAAYGALSVAVLPVAGGTPLWLVGGADGRIHAYARGASGLQEVPAAGADLGAPVERLAVWARAGAPPCVLAYAAPAIRRLCVSGSALVAQDRANVASEPASLFVLRDTAGGDTAARLYAAFPGQGAVGVYDAGRLQTPVVLVPGLGRPVAVAGSAAGTATDRHVYVADAAARRVVALADSAPTDQAAWRVYRVPAGTSVGAVAGAASFGGGQQPTVTVPLAPGRLDASGLRVRDARIADGSATVELWQAGIARGPRAGGRGGDVVVRIGAGGPNALTVRVTVPPGAYTSFTASLAAGGGALVLHLVKAPPTAPTGGASGGSPPPPTGGGGGGGGGGGAG